MRPMRTADRLIVTHPLMVGLLQSLPAEGEAFPAEERERWLNAVRVNFDFIYGPAEESEPSDQNGRRLKPA